MLFSSRSPYLFVRDLSDRMSCAVGSNELTRPDSDPCDGRNNRSGFGGRFASFACASASPPLLDWGCAYRIGSGTGHINRRLISRGLCNWTIGEVKILGFACTDYAPSSARVGFFIADKLRSPCGEH